MTQFPVHGNQCVSFLLSNEENLGRAVLRSTLFFHKGEWIGRG